MLLVNKADYELQQRESFICGNSLTTRDFEIHLISPTQIISPGEIIWGGNYLALYGNVVFSIFD